MPTEKNLKKRQKSPETVKSKKGPRKKTGRFLRFWGEKLVKGRCPGQETNGGKQGNVNHQATMGGRN